MHHLLQFAAVNVWRHLPSGTRLPRKRIFNLSLSYRLEDRNRQYLEGMKARDFIASFSITFAIAFLANVLVSIAWNYFIKKIGWQVDWEGSVRISIMLAIVIPLIQRKK